MSSNSPYDPGGAYPHLTGKEAGVRPGQPCNGDEDDMWRETGPEQPWWVPRRESDDERNTASQP